jgi:tripartite-type tricarboxylate transporter receptor subunit TctC
MSIASRLAGPLLFASFCGLGLGTAHAQDYPDRPIRMIVANTPGTVADTLGRLMAAEMSKSLGQPIVVENKPGANAIIGLEYVVNQKPADGYLLVSTAVSALASLPVTVKQLRFDPLKDLPPFIGLVEGPYVFGSPAAAPWQDFDGFIAHAKAHPRQLNYGAPAPTVQLPIEALIHAIGLDIVHVPYKGGGPYMQAIIANEVQLGLIPESAARSFGERFRPLAVTGDKRLAAFPQVPTFQELGYPQIRGLAYSLNTPAGAPKAAVEKLHAAASRALQDPEVRSRIEKMGFTVTDQSPEIAARALADEAGFLADVARKIGMEPQ